MTLTKQQRDGHLALLDALRATYQGQRLDRDAERLEAFLIGVLADDDEKRAEREAARKAKRTEKGGSWAGDDVE